MGKEILNGIQDNATEYHAYVSHFGALKCGDTKPIVAANFAGDDLDRTLWVETSTNGGSVDLVQGVGNLTVDTSGDKEELITRKTGRFVAGQVTVFQTGVFPVGAGVVGNVREWGLASEDRQQKLVFRLDGTDFQIVTVRDGVENVIGAANFSEAAGYTLAAQNRTWRIDYSAGRALFFDAAGGERRLLHVEVDSQAPLVNGLNLNGYYSNENTTNASTVLLGVRGSSISIWSQLPLTDLFFQRDHSKDGALPSGAAYVVPAIPDATPPANVIDSGYILREEFKVAFNHVFADVPLKLYIINSANTLGEGAQGLNFANLQNQAGLTATVSAPIFNDYVRFVLVNESGTDATVWNVDCRKQNENASPVYLSLDQTVLKGFPAPLGQNVIRAENPDGVLVLVRQGGKHTLNSSTVLLPANGVFRGIWYEWQAEGYNGLSVTASSDVNGTLYIDFSEDITPVDGDDSSVFTSFVLSYDVNVVDAIRRYAPAQYRWVRVRYVNGVAAQVSFDLFTSFLTQAPTLVMSPVANDVDDDNLAALVTNVNRALAEDGSHKRMTLRGAGGHQSLNTSVDEIDDDVAIKPADTWQAPTEVVVGATPVQLDAIKPANRRSIKVSNQDPEQAIYLGPSDDLNEIRDWLPRETPWIQCLDNTVDVWAAIKGGGSTETTLEKLGNTASGTATNVSNALVSDDTYALIDADGETVEIEGFDSASINTIQSIALVLEGKKSATPASETASFVDVVTGTAGNTGSVTSGTVTSNADHKYYAFIARRNTSALVTSVTGMGLTWTQAVTDAVGGESRVSCFEATGTPTGDGTVTASFSELATNSVLMVGRLDDAMDIENIEAVTGTGNSYNDSINGTDLGEALVFAGFTNQSHTAGSGFTEQQETSQGTGSNTASAALSSLDLTSTGVQAYSGTFSGSVDWALIALTVTPRDTDDPQVELSYELSAVAGATTGIVTLTSTEAEHKVDITSDETWEATDVPNITAIATGDVISSAAAECDLLALEIVDTTGVTVRVSVSQVGGAS